jgi:hypothetical protein
VPILPVRMRLERGQRALPGLANCPNAPRDSQVQQSSAHAPTRAPNRSETKPVDSANTIEEVEIARFLVARASGFARGGVLRCSDSSSPEPCACGIWTHIISLEIFGLSGIKDVVKYNGEHCAFVPLPTRETSTELHLHIRRLYVCLSTLFHKTARACGLTFLRDARGSIH